MTTTDIDQQVAPTRTPASGGRPNSGGTPTRATDANEPGPEGLPVETVRTGTATRPIGSVAAGTSKTAVPASLASLKNSMPLKLGIGVAVALVAVYFTYKFIK